MWFLTSGDMSGMPWQWLIPSTKNKYIISAVGNYKTTRNLHSWHWSLVTLILFHHHNAYGICISWLSNGWVYECRTIENTLFWRDWHRGWCWWWPSQQGMMQPFWHSKWQSIQNRKPKSTKVSSRDMHKSLLRLEKKKKRKDNAGEPH